MKIRAASDQSVLVYLGDTIGLESHQRVVRLLRQLQRQRLEWVRNLQPAYCSLLVTFDTCAVDHGLVEAALREFEDKAEAAPAAESRVVEIPVCYGGELGPDLLDVAAACGMKPHRVVELHSAETYHAYFVGFAPGFAYLGDVPEQIATRRLAMPRPRVPAGSLGIAGRQTGVYPFATPGGWRILGRTPLAMFKADREPMALIAVGDQVKFKPITQDQFLKMEQA